MAARVLSVSMARNMTDSNRAVRNANLWLVRLRVVLGVSLLLLVLAPAGSAGPASGSAASASAFGVRVVLPGKSPVSAGLFL